MVETFLFITFLLFAVAGICEFLYILTIIFTFPRCRCHTYAVVVLKKGYAVKQLNFLWQKLKWRGNDYAKGIIAIIDDIDYNELLVCRNFIIGKDITLCCAQSVVHDCEYMQGEH